MNYATTVMTFAAAAQDKAAFLQRDPIAFLILAVMAGAYVGFGILLIFSVGQGVDASIRPIVMGASFGIALMLVIFAGSDFKVTHYPFLGCLTVAVLYWLS